MVAFIDSAYRFAPAGPARLLTRLVRHQIVAELACLAVFVPLAYAGDGYVLRHFAVAAMVFCIFVDVIGALLPDPEPVPWETFRVVHAWRLLTHGWPTTAWRLARRVAVVTLQAVGAAGFWVLVITSALIVAVERQLDVVALHGVAVLAFLVFMECSESTSVGAEPEPVDLVEVDQ